MSQFVSKIKSIKGGFTTALPINITDLINRRAVKNARVGYKRNWSPETILHPICVFANVGADIIVLWIPGGDAPQNITNRLWSSSRNDFLLFPHNLSINAKKHRAKKLDLRPAPI